MIASLFELARMLARADSMIFSMTNYICYSKQVLDRSCLFEIKPAVPIMGRNAGRNDKNMRIRASGTRTAQLQVASAYTIVWQHLTGRSKCGTYFAYYGAKSKLLP